ncbi:MAG: hypothetical protein R2932_33760 [Caldilineaceae bacterium]
MVRTQGFYALESFVELLTNSGYNPTAKEGPFNSNDLTGLDVVILEVNDESAITAAEVTLLQTWVNSGGALLVLYEGSGDQSIANAFGVAFSTGLPGIIVDPTDSQGYPYDFVVFYQKDNFSDHSILQTIHEIYTWQGYAVTGAGSTDFS